MRRTEGVQQKYKLLITLFFLSLLHTKPKKREKVDILVGYVGGVMSSGVIIGFNQRERNRF